MSPEREPHRRTADDVEAEVRQLMARLHAIAKSGWQTRVSDRTERASLREDIDRLLDEHAMRRDVAALVL